MLATGATDFPVFGNGLFTERADLPRKLPDAFQAFRTEDLVFFLTTETLLRKEKLPNDFFQKRKHDKELLGENYLFCWATIFFFCTRSLNFFGDLAEAVCLRMS